MHSMRIVLNHRDETLAVDKQTISIIELLVLKKFTYKNIITKINGQLVRREERSEAEIRDGDNVEVIHLITGG
jgi:thiamine biosynthesis protein ThiS